jgi:hypothetical protein
VLVARDERPASRAFDRPLGSDAIDPTRRCAPTSPASGEVKDHEQLEVDAMLTLDQLLGEFGTPIDCLEHAKSVRTNVRYVKLIYTKNSSKHHTYMPPSVTPPPSSQSCFRHDSSGMPEPEVVLLFDGT